MTQSPSRFWDELTWEDFQTLDPERTVAILPVSATEQHGPHLPLSVDAIINRGVLERSLALVPTDLPLLVLPAMPIGFSLEHSAFPGTLTAGAETLHALWRDIGRAVHRAGLRKLVILNSHGGQPQIAEIVARELRSELAMMVVVACTYALGEPTDLFSESERRHGIHGGASETSVMLHLRPDLVRRDKLANFPSAAAEIEKDHRELRLEGDPGIKTGWQTQDLNPQGACGDATSASAEAGKTVVEQAARRLATLLAETSAYPLANLKPGPPKP
jgi:creatinine amidohydrolase